MAALFGIPQSLLDELPNYDELQPREVVLDAEDAFATFDQDSEESSPQPRDVALDLGTLSLRQLRALAKHVGASTTGNKGALADRLKDVKPALPLPEELASLEEWFV